MPSNATFWGERGGAKYRIYHYYVDCRFRKLRTSTVSKATKNARAPTPVQIFIDSVPTLAYVSRTASRWSASKLRIASAVEKCNRSAICADDSRPRPRDSITRARQPNTAFVAATPILPPSRRACDAMPWSTDCERGGTRWLTQMLTDEKFIPTPRPRRTS